MSQQQKEDRNEVFHYIKIFVITFAVVLLCKNFLFTPIMVKGASMEPTYENKDVILINRVSTIHRFDQIVFKAPVPERKGELFVKRVVGLPGDTIEMRDDVLYVNGEAYEEDYVNRRSDSNLRTTEDFTLSDFIAGDKVPEGKFFVLGDNRMKSLDSRHYGLVDAKIIMGKSMATLYPFSNISLP